MKQIILLFFGFLVSHQCFSQSLEGEWKGELIITSTSAKPLKAHSSPVPISLKFILNQDSTYNIYSYSPVQNLPGKEIIIICKVNYKLLPKNSIYLEETEVLNPEYYFNNCFQKMYLKMIRKKKTITLYGTWENIHTEFCDSAGSIHFDKILTN